MKLKRTVADQAFLDINSFYLHTRTKPLRDHLQLSFFNLGANDVFLSFRLKGGSDDSITPPTVSCSDQHVSSIAPIAQKSFFLDSGNSPNTWLLLIDFSFSAHRLTPASKAHHVLSLLPTELLQSLGPKIIDTMTKPNVDHYSLICQVVRDFYKPSETELFDTYFRTQTLGPFSPSQFLAKARTDLERLQPGSSSNLTILKRFFLSVLPPTARAILAGSEDSSIEHLANTADKIILNLPISSPVSSIDTSVLDLIKTLSDQVASLQLEVSSQRRSRSPSRGNTFERSRSQSNFRKRLICSHHFKLKDGATKCCIGCNWSNQRGCQITSICVFHSIFSDNARHCLPGCTFSKN